jgi:hypothetical protein
MKQKIKVPIVWYNEWINAHIEGIVGEPINMNMWRLRLEAMQINLPCHCDVQSGVTIEQLKQFVLDGESRLGSSKIALDKFISKYEPCGDLLPDYNGAEKYFIKNKNKINNGDLGVYNVMTVVEDKFKLPFLTEKQQKKLFKIMDKVGIETY